MTSLTNWAKSQAPMSPKQMGARIKKMHEMKAMARGEMVAPSFDDDVPDWARGTGALDFPSSMTPHKDEPYSIGWLARLLQYIRNEFSQFVSIVSGYTPFQYYAGPYSPWDKNVHYIIPYETGSAGWEPARLLFGLGREYITSEGTFRIDHTIVWDDGEPRKKDSIYSCEMTVISEDCYVNTTWNRDHLRIGLKPNFGTWLYPWMPRGLDGHVSCAYRYNDDKIDWGVDIQYRAEHSHWGVRYAPQTFHINFYAGFIRGFSAGLAYTYNHKYGVSAWSTSGYWEYGTDPEDEDEAGTTGWGYAIDLNPHGGFHASLALDRCFNIPSQPIYVAAIYSFAYGGDDIVTSYHAGFRTTMPWINIDDFFNSHQRPEEHDDTVHDARHGIYKGLELDDNWGGINDAPDVPIDERTTVVAFNWRSSGFWGWQFSFEPFGYEPTDDKPGYPITVSCGLDVGLMTGGIVPMVEITSEY